MNTTVPDERGVGAVHGPGDGSYPSSPQALDLVLTVDGWDRSREHSGSDSETVKAIGGDHAACADTSLAAWFVESSSPRRTTEPGAVAAEARALRVCATRCPGWVRDECLAEQVTWEIDEKHRPSGIYGGTTPSMRRDPRLKDLSTDERIEVLKAWSQTRVLPKLLATNETLTD